jgi:hypothetical protein
MLTVSFQKSYLRVTVHNTVVCYEERPERCVKAVSIKPVLTEAEQAQSRRETVPVLLIRIHNKSRGNNSPTQKVSVDTPSKRSVSSAYTAYFHSNCNFMGLSWPQQLITSLVLHLARLCGLVVRVLGYTSRGPGSISGLPDFLRSSGSGTGFTQPREYN